MGLWPDWLGGRYHCSCKGIGTRWFLRTFPNNSMILWLKKNLFSAVCFFFFNINYILLLNEMQNSLVFKYIVKIQEIKFRNKWSVFTVQSQEKTVPGLEYSPSEKQKLTVKWQSLLVIWFFFRVVKIKANQKKHIEDCRILSD